MIRVTAFIILAVQLSAIAAAPASRPTTQPQPDPKYSPTEVVQIQLAAMQHNDRPATDAGIATAFQFASPKNQLATGPLDRFIAMVKTPGYLPMLDFKLVDYAPPAVRDDTAEQLVKITDSDGNAAIYVFVLSKQKDGKYKDCWMTDGVLRLQEKQPDEPAEQKPVPKPVRT